MFSAFCIHQYLLLSQISNESKRKNEDDEENLLTRKRQTSSKNAKRRRTDLENDAAVINRPTTEIHEEIKLVKKKKSVELNSNHLSKVEILKMENLMKSFKSGKYKDFKNHCVKVMNENIEAVHIANELTIEQADTNILARS